MIYLVIVCGDFNLPGVNWYKNNESLVFSGTISDKVRVIGNQYALINFAQQNSIRNQNAALLDLVFSGSSLSIEQFEPNLDSIVARDTRHPALSISCPLPVDQWLTINIPIETSNKLILGKLNLVFVSLIGIKFSMKCQLTKLLLTYKINVRFYS